MPLSTILAASFARSFALYAELIDAVNEDALSAKLPGLPSNTVGLQLWCVVGARESFTVAIKANAWSGFTCSLADPTGKGPVREVLGSSARGVSEVLGRIDNFTEVQYRLIVDLLEHEAAHQGQLIRYLYGLRLPIPGSWKARYALG
jgi:hypothetical protein